jgi:hypothetical protein
MTTYQDLCPAVVSNYSDSGKYNDPALQDADPLLPLNIICKSSRTSERGGEGDCMKEGGGGEGERERERALGLLLCHI